MNVLLLSMPDSFEHMPPAVVRMPNGALTSLAGNVDPHHRVAVADLILVQRSVRDTVTRLVREMNPEVVGLSVMTFQRCGAWSRSWSAAMIPASPRKPTKPGASITWGAARAKLPFANCSARSKLAR